MRILATGDWHIGKSAYGLGRAEEHRHFLGWLKEQAIRTRADALLVTGDVFDSKDPTPLSQEIYYSFLDDISQACPGLRIVIIAGNHDNPTLLEAPQSILKRHKVDVFGSAEGCDSTDQSDNPLILPVENNSGERVWVIAVPYLRRSDFRFDLSYEKSVTDYLSALVRAARAKSSQNEPVVMIAHLYAAGSLNGNDDGRSETIYVGGEPEIRMTSLKDRPDFLFSGHIHKRMEINGVPWAQYTGSALTMSFVERDYVHGADLLTVRPGEDPEREFLEYTPLTKFKSYGPASPEDVAGAIRKDLSRLDANTVIETKVLLDAVDSETKVKLENMVKGIVAKMVYNPEIKEKKSEGGKYSRISRPEDLSSDEIVREVILRRFAGANADEMNEKEKALLETVITEARRCDNNK